MAGLEVVPQDMEGLGTQQLFGREAQHAVYFE